MAGLGPQDLVHAQDVRSAELLSTCMQAMAPYLDPLSEVYAGLSHACCTGSAHALPQHPGHHNTSRPIAPHSRICLYRPN